ncbi:MAG TPA: methyltransferase domain-containing protein [Candidatus Dormibacteraeota bacterium]|jgi:ubiquinone/menaquinone biosynthesis C-methylase UbiE|nr:methyltransferase domain-containing protein [Candidatus Dormibacteraeota bacterium]
MSDPSPFPAALSWLIDNPLRRAGARRFVARLGLRPGMRVVDVGCGPGRLSLACAAVVGEAGEVLAVDLQPEMVDRLERRAGRAGLANIRTLVAGAGDGGLPAGAFDRALLAYVLGEVPAGRRGAAVADIAAALRPGGRLVVAESLMDPHRQGREVVRSLGAAAGLEERGVEESLLGFVMTLERTGPSS